MRLILFLFISAALTCRVAVADLPSIILPKTALQPDEIAIIVNDRDPLSVRIGEYYQQARSIPPDNLIRIELDPTEPWVKPADFSPLWQQLQQRTPDHIQAYALTWAQPYRVGCMSVTTAFAAGFDQRWCSATQCAPTQKSAYFNSATATPYQTLRIRPTMSIAATSFEQARALIDRGIAADESHPNGTAYLLSTSDKQRNVRAHFFPQTHKYFAPFFTTEIIQRDVLSDKDDVMFYFTGKTFIDKLDTLTFLPGAMADHLTSAGGQLTDSKQMSALRWLETGATGSYGTVREPCNLPGKFPHPGIAMDHYLSGRTLLESYWASVQMPGEGIFIGEPLARPFGGYQLSREGNAYRLETRQLRPGQYRILVAPSLLGPYRALRTALTVKPGQKLFYLPNMETALFKLQPVKQP